MEMKALRDCFVDNNYRKTGEQFEYSGPKNENLTPVKAARPQPTGLTEDEKEH